MTEWWQKDEGDVPVPVPRRDAIPESGFSDPRSAEVSPELAFFIPEYRAKRRVIAIIVSAVAIPACVWSVVIVIRAMFISCPYKRAQAFPGSIFLAVLAVASAAVAWYVWQWSNERDRRDLKHRDPGF